MNSPSMPVDQLLEHHLRRQRIDREIVAALQSDMHENRALLGNYARSWLLRCDSAGVPKKAYRMATPIGVLEAPEGGEFEAVTRAAFL